MAFNKTYKFKVEKEKGEFGAASCKGKSDSKSLEARARVLIREEEVNRSLEMR